MEENTCTVGESGLKSLEGEQYSSARPFCMEKNKCGVGWRGFKNLSMGPNTSQLDHFAWRENTCTIGESTLKS
jgi:hypothetical protein